MIVVIDERLSIVGIEEVFRCTSEENCIGILDFLEENN
jgi:hypothetical protein